MLIHGSSLISMKITGLDSESGRYVFLQLDLPKNNTGISPNSLKMSQPFPGVFEDFFCY